MSKQVRVDLVFQSNTQQAKTQLQDLQNQLSKLYQNMAQTGANFGFTKEMREASDAVAQLGVHLRNATNVNTGVLDFTKLNDSLKRSGVTLSQYGDQLRKLGPAGQQAFISLAEAVTRAEIPLRRTSTLFNQMWITMKNTMKWQLSSSALHGFIGTIQSAYGYAQDLNKSLNNIRIVSGSSADEMARFAEEANKAAKRLDTTTVAYTDAALIYYQQGLKDQEVKERTDITVKMANVTGNTVEEVSNQLTSVWNNFNKEGEESYERYADVMTALGAATASSTDEIAGGLEKFSAVADTIGLSFDYAASALATITATTRQSEEVVGTALKTIFARIQGLKLGETLDDGTTLNKYSEALNKVGISIFDQSGQLKDMDSILDEMGSKWAELNKDQQVALAQTVAGTRQYNQLLALMDNWTFFNKNLETAANATGTLNEQAQIYGESWQAAQKNVQAAAESIYSNLLDDDFFITMLNGFEDVLTGVNNLIDGLGGLKGILLAIGSLATSVFSQQISKGLQNMAYNVSMMLPGGRQKAEQSRQNFLADASTMMSSIEYTTTEGTTRGSILQRDLELQQQIAKYSNQMSVQEKELVGVYQQQLQIMAKQVINKARIADEAKDQASTETQAFLNYQSQQKAGVTSKTLANRKVQMNSLLRAQGSANVITQSNMSNELKIQELSKIAQANNIKVEVGADTTQLMAAIDQAVLKAQKKFRNLYTFKNDQSQQNNFEQQMIANANAQREAGRAAKEAELGLQGYNAQMDNVNNKIPQMTKGITDWSSKTIVAANSIFTLSMVMSSMSGIAQTLQSDISTTEKVITSLASAAMVLPMIINTVSTLQTTLATSSSALLVSLAPFLPIIAAVGIAIGGLALIISSFVKTEEDARKSIEDATQAYEEQKSVVDELNSSLETTKDRIRELSLQDSLTIVEQEELNKLKRQEQLLQNQLTLEQELLKIKAQDRARTFEEDFRTAYKSLREAPLTKENIPNQINATNQEISELQKKIEDNNNKLLDIDSSTSEGYSEQQRIMQDNAEYQRQIQQLQYQIENLQIAEKNAPEDNSKWKAEVSDSYSQAEQKFANYISDIEEGYIEANSQILENNRQELETYRKNMFNEAEYQEIFIDPFLENQNENGYVDDLFQQAVNDKLSEESLSDEVKQQAIFSGLSPEELVDVINARVDKILSSSEITDTSQWTYEDWMKAVEANSAGLNPEKLSQFDNKYGFDFSSAITTGMKSGEGDFDFSNIFSEMSQDQYDALKYSFNQITPDDFIKMMGITEDTLKTAGFKSASQFKGAFNTAFNEYSSETYISSANADGEALAEQYELDIDEFKDYRDLLQDTNEEYENNIKGLNDVALANKRMEKGVKDLANSWEDYDEVMSDSNSTIEDISSILPEVNEAVQNILNLNDEDFELLPKDFAQKNWALIQDVVNGVEGAVDDLRNKAGEEILLNIEGTVDPNGQLKAELADLHNWIMQMDNSQFEVGVQLDPVKHAEFIANCEALINAAKMTSEQAQAYFAAMGYDVDVEKVEDVSEDLSSYTVYPLDREKTTEAGGVPQFGDPYEITMTGTKTTSALAIKTITPLGSYGGGIGVKTTAPKTTTKSTSSGGGGSSSPAKKQDMTKKSEVVERYYEIDNAIQDLTESLDDANEASDRLFGKSKLASMDKEVQLLEKQTELLQKKRKEAIQYLALDQSALMYNQYGIDFEFDDVGNITNYTQIMESLYNELHQAQIKLNTAFSTSEAQSDYEESVVQPIQDKIDEITDLINQYDETRDTLQELSNELDSAFYEWQDKNYEKLTYKVEFKIEINDSDLEIIEYYLDKTSDNFYKMAEDIALMKDQGSVYVDSLDIYKDQLEALEESYAKGEISQTSYIEGLKEAKSAIIDNLTSLHDLNKEMVDYYKEALASAQEELSNFTSQMEHQTSVLEHYQNMLSLIGKENDFKMVGTLLESQLKTNQNLLEVQQQNYESLLKQKEELESKLNSIPLGSNQRELIEKQYQAIIEAANDAQTSIFKTTASIGELAAQILENSLSTAKKQLEETLTGGISLDEYLEKVDRLNTSQEEFLTKTNQLYEINKLIKEAEIKLSEEDNVLAQQKYKDYIKYLESLEDQSKLSKYELEIAQAKYEVLKAEIALEQARNNATSMRLVRDDNGNYDYVFTADQDKIIEAEQNLAEAQNNLYNIGLEGAKEYQDKYNQIMQDAIAALEQINENYQLGMYESEEEYQAAMLETRNYYYDLLKQYQDLYYIGHNQMVEESYNNEADYLFAGIDNLEDFKNATDEYLQNCNDSFKNWQQNTSNVTDIVGENFEDLENKVNNVVDSNNSLADSITSNVLPAMDNELNGILEITDAWNNYYSQLGSVIKQHETFISKIQKTVKEIASIQTSAINASNSIKDAILQAQKAISSSSYSYSTPSYSGGGGGSGGGSGGSSSRPSNSSSRPSGSSTVKKPSDIAAEKYLEQHGVDPRMYPKDYSYDSKNKIWKKRTKYPSGPILGVFDTGGYTGSWGSEGKLAVLHEKEIVLNKTDTANFLKAANILRKISDVLNVPLLAHNLISDPSKNINSTTGNNIQQDIIINAEFPNAIDSSEIEQAFNNLINDAIQYTTDKSK